MIYALANGLFERLGIGTTGQVLKVAGGVPTWGTIDVAALSTALQALLVPAGTVVYTCAATAPTGWVAVIGQTIVNAQSLYPAWWAVAPAAWKSGSNLVLPDGRDRAIFGSGASYTLGTVGGSNTRQLVEANLPPHAHSFARNLALPARLTATLNAISHLSNEPMRRVNFNRRGWNLKPLRLHHNAHPRTFCTKFTGGPSCSKPRSSS
jgi:microcystin-dependent protein